MGHLKYKSSVMKIKQLRPSGKFYYRYRVTIPIALVETLGLKGGEKVEWNQIDKRTILLKIK